MAKAVEAAHLPTNRLGGSSQLVSKPFKSKDTSVAALRAGSCRPQLVAWHRVCGRLGVRLERGGR